jgi:hypothetical protein
MARRIARTFPAPVGIPYIADRIASVGKEEVCVCETTLAHEAIAESQLTLENCHGAWAKVTDTWSRSVKRRI